VHVLIHAAGANVGGAVTYVAQALRELVAADRGDRFTVLAPPEALAPIDDLLRGPACSAVVYRHPPGKIGRRLWLDQVEVRRLLVRSGADVLYSTNGVGTFRSPRPQALLVGNAAAFSHELDRLHRARGSGSGATRLRRAWTALSVRSADRVLFPTAAMGRRVARWVRFDETRARVVPYGFSHAEFFDERAPRPPAADAMARSRAEGARVLLSVSTHSLHKNLETLVEALAEVRREREAVRLVLTIDRERTGDPAAYDELVARISALGLDDAVLHAGHVSYGSLHHL
jgi:glycosyltransferase involved in cell wall biosynthesis